MAAPDREPLTGLWTSSGRTGLRIPCDGTAGLPTGARFLETAAPDYQTTACTVETWPNRCRHCDLAKQALACCPEVQPSALKILASSLSFGQLLPCLRSSSRAWLGERSVVSARCCTSWSSP